MLGGVVPETLCLERPLIRVSFVRMVSMSTSSLVMKHVIPIWEDIWNLTLIWVQL